jgi:hypothetical protein
MSLGRYASDLEEGDVFEPVVYTMTPFMVREYCHGTGVHAESFQGPSADGSVPQRVPPTLVHLDKIRLLYHNCPEGAGPDARIHYQYQATHHQPVPVGERLRASGKVSRRYEKRGREYLELQIELRSDDTGELFTTYVDTAILGYKKKEESS